MADKARNGKHPQFSAWLERLEGGDGQVGEKHPEVWKGGLLLALLLLLAAGLVFALVHKHPGVAESKPPRLNEPALKFAASMLTEDLQTGLEGGESALAKTHDSNLLDWARIDQRVTAQEYENLYDDNEIAADKLYRGKRLLVSGIVSRIEEDFAGNGNVWLKGSGLMGVPATLNERGKTAALSWHSGQRVTLVCAGSGRLVTVATLKDCEPPSSYVATLHQYVQTRVEAFLDGKLVLDKASSGTIILGYVLGLTMPSDLTCFHGDQSSCEQEMTALLADPRSAKVVQEKVRQMAVTLKVK